VFRDYHLRVGEVVRDAGTALPQMRFDETQVGAARAVTVVEMPVDEVPPDAAGLVDWDMFDGITDPSGRLLLLSWRDAAAMQAWMPRDGTGQGGTRRCDVRVVRDYGMNERAEAPQFHR